MTPTETIILTIAPDTPGVTSMARQAKCSTRTVKRALASLCELGVLRASESGGGRGNKAVYKRVTLKGDTLIAETAPLPAVKGDKRVTLKGDIDGQNVTLYDAPQEREKVTKERENSYASLPETERYYVPKDKEGSLQWLTTLREIPGWHERGEPHLKSLSKWVADKAWSAEELEASAIGLSSVQTKTLKGYASMASAFQRRLSMGYDRNGTPQSNGQRPRQSFDGPDRLETMKKARKEAMQ